MTRYDDTALPEAPARVPEVSDPPAPPAEGGSVRLVDESPIRVMPTAVSPLAVPPDAELDHHSVYFNRELSWLDFNWRVLHQAMDPRNPLLERVKFLAITESNLDEFFRKRVGGLKRQVAAGVLRLSPDGRTPGEQLDLIRKAVLVMRETMGRLWSDDLCPALASRAGVVIQHHAELDPGETERLEEHFHSNIYPILTPLAVDPGHPFPFISNLSLSLALVLHHPARDSLHFARLKIPSSRGRFVPLQKENHFILLEELVKEHVDLLFKGMHLEGAYLFRVTRNADLRRDEEEADDLLEMISEELRERRAAPVVRLEVAADMPEDVRRILCTELSLGEDDLYEVTGLMDFSELDVIGSLKLPRLRFPIWEPVTPPPLVHEGESEDLPDIFAAIRRSDILVHHPYESFASSVQRFIEEAADDPRVLAIKQTLYRTSDDSPVVKALIRAAEAGKQVAVLVEVKARFDEQNNIEWGQMLERHGVHVTYGLVGLKTHAKAALVIREEADGIRAYCHVGTGNYHSGTARLYTDLGLLTCREEIGTDLVNLFHYLTGHAPEQEYSSLVVAPRDMRNRLVRLVGREIEHQEATGDGHIFLKLNALDDLGMIQTLYRASRAGVKVDLIIRGHSRLRPGLPRFSDNVRVVSIVGRFLEHDRIFWFKNGGDPIVYFGSADWRRRNLDDRVEALVQVDDAELKERLRQILVLGMSDNRLSWDLEPNGRYTLRVPESARETRNFHEILMRRALERRESADPPWELEPGMPPATR